MASVTVAKTPVTVARRPRTDAYRPAVALTWLQGSYFLLTGLWPIVHLRSFLWVTGQKTDHMVTGREADHWLLMTVSVLIASIAVALLVAAYRRQIAPETSTLAIGAALGLTAIDVIYVARQVILPIYLLDAAIELVFIAAWAIVLLAQPRWRPATREGAVHVS